MGKRLTATILQRTNEDKDAAYLWNGAFEDRRGGVESTARVKFNSWSYVLKDHKEV
jgi:hypothetical protein